MSKKKRQKLPEKKSNTTLIYAAIAVLAVVVIAVLLLNFSSTPQPPEKLPSAGGYVNLSLPITHLPAGKVEIIEFLKFDWCPRCYDLNNNLPQLLEKYGNNVNITYVPIVWPGESTKSIEAYIIADQQIFLSSNACGFEIKSEGVTCLYGDDAIQPSTKRMAETRIIDL